uniref:Cation-transporting ATPase n=1 Tax=Timema monikensis TaxID=170555 RepID=A0A7R9E261_9NEOP|nr:unnamed protein product [Timema monikensis]
MVPPCCWPQVTSTWPDLSDRWRNSWAGVGEGIPLSKAFYGLPQAKEPLAQLWEIYGYKRNLLYTTCAWLCILMTMGFVQLIFHWYPQICLYSTHKKCSLQQAEKLLIVLNENYQGKYKMYYIKAVKRISAANTSVKDEAKRGGLVNVNHSQNGVKNTLKFRLATGSSLGGTAKGQWRKLNGCHRDALRRLKPKRSGDAGMTKKFWTYQK